MTPSYKGQPSKNRSTTGFWLGSIKCVTYLHKTCMCNNHLPIVQETTSRFEFLRIKQVVLIDRQMVTNKP